MKKVLYCVFAAITAFFGTAYFSHNTYATEVPVMFKITNHKAEVTADILSDDNIITIKDIFPNVKVTYKNAIRVSLRIEDKNEDLVESKTQAVDLSDVEEELTFDLSEVKVEPGDYYIKVSATNVDDDESNADDLDLSVYTKAPDIPNTGSQNLINEEFLEGDNVIMSSGLIIAGLFSLIFCVKKGVLR